MAESQHRIALPSSSVRGTNIRAEQQACKFGTVVRALWPVKPALNLAQRVGCTERAANFYINGERAPPLDAILVIVNEIRGRRRG